MATFFTLKDPNDKLDYTIDYSNFFQGADAIATSSWTCVDNIVTVIASSTTPTSATVWVQGGTASMTSTVTNIITTTNTPNRQLYRRIEFTLMQR